MGILENIPPGKAWIHFEKYDPEHPPESDHYIVYCKDKKMNIDFISPYGVWGGSAMYGCGYEVLGYAKITTVIFDNKVAEYGSSKP